MAKYKYKIKLENSKDICKFVQITRRLTPKIILIDPANNYQTNAKSLLSVLSTVKWDSTWCECEEDIFTHICQFIRR